MIVFNIFNIPLCILDEKVPVFSKIIFTYLHNLFLFVINIYVYITGAQGVDQVDGAVTEGDDDDDTLGSCIYLIVDSQDQLLLNVTPQAISVIKDVMQVLRTRKEGSVLFNDALNTLYLWFLYGVTHMVKDHSDSERGNPLPPHGLLFPISRQDNTYHQLWSTGWNEKCIANNVCLFCDVLEAFNNVLLFYIKL